MGDTVIGDWVKIGLAATAFILVAKYLVGPGGLVKIPGVSQAVGSV